MSQGKQITVIKDDSKVKMPWCKIICCIESDCIYSIIQKNQVFMARKPLALVKKKLCYRGILM